jgi:cbb3-type cytochrome oxidase subunit 3
MLDEGNTLNMMETPDAPPPEEKSNRTFLIVAGVMAGLVFLTLVCMAIYYFAIYRPSRSKTQNAATQAAVIQTQNAQSIQNATLTAQALLWTPTLPPPTATATPRPTGSPTPVIAMGSPIATATSNPVVLFAAQTQLASQLTSTAIALLPTRTLGGSGMPSTGFFDEVGLPSMIILALALVVVIFLARRMRKSPAK